MTRSEKLIKDLCELAFLKMWSHPNPKRIDNNKELTDLLVYVHPYVIIFSVKEINLSSERDENIREKRWHKKAIMNSIKQILGAERALLGKIKFYGTNNLILSINNIEDIKFYRIAIAFGSEGNFTYRHEFIKGKYIHIFDEISTILIFKELNTIIDFVKYLDKKESFIKGKKIYTEREIDMIAYYCKNNKEFPDVSVDTYFEKGIWEKYLNHSSYSKKLDEEKKSYFWDNLINHFTFHQFNKTLVLNSSSLEEPLRLLALESRFNRRILSNSFLDILENHTDPEKVSTRTVISPSGIVYIFFIMDIRSDYENLNDLRRSVLYRKCFATRYLYKDYKKIVGIGVNPFMNLLESIDLIYFELDEMSEDFIEEASMYIKKLGIHSNVLITENSIKEYPE
jgi:hypothetical protein